MNVIAKTSSTDFEPAALMAEFDQNESFAAGTVLIHHGKIKGLAKKIPDFKDVLLEPVCDDPQGLLYDAAKKVKERFGLLQVMIVHRTGVVTAGGDVLFAVISSKTRKEAFMAMEKLIDAVKEEKAVRLIERP